jgi:hypothetical protein
MGCCVSVPVNCAGQRCWSSTRLATCRSPQAAAICSSSSSTGYEKGLTSNRGFTEQREIFGDPSSPLCCSIAGCTTRIEGSSYRLRPHADLVPEHFRAKDLPTPPPAPPRRGSPRKKPKDRKKGSLPAKPNRPLPPGCARAISRAGVCRNFAPLGACNSL